MNIAHVPNIGKKLYKTSIKHVLPNGVLMNFFLSPPANRQGLLVCIFSFLALTIALNGLIFAFGFNDNPTVVGEGILPPGYVIGSVWTVLFIAMAGAYWQVASEKKSRAGDKYHILAFVGFCLAYPIFTIGFSQPLMVILGNVICIVWSGALFGYFIIGQRFVALLLLLPAIWVMYVTCQLMLGLL